jgi:hypothetical protein
MLLWIVTVVIRPISILWSRLQINYSISRNRYNLCIFKFISQAFVKYIPKFLQKFEFLCQVEMLYTLVCKQNDWLFYGTIQVFCLQTSLSIHFELQKKNDKILAKSGKILSIRLYALISTIINYYIFIVKPYYVISTSSAKTYNIKCQTTLILFIISMTHPGDDYLYEKLCIINTILFSSMLAWNMQTIKSKSS